MFELDGYYNIQIEMTGPSHTDDFEIAFQNKNTGYTGNPVADLTSSQNAHDTLENLANGFIAGMLNNNSGRWTSGSVLGVFKVPTSLTAV